MRTLVGLTTLAVGLIGAGCGPGNSQHLLRSAVDAQQDSLESCYEDALARDETLAGVVRARLHVERANGTVREVEVLESASSDESLRMCMASALTGIRLAETPKVDLTVDYEFELVPNAAGSGAVVQR